MDLSRLTCDEKGTWTLHRIMICRNIPRIVFLGFTINSSFAFFTEHLGTIGNVDPPFADGAEGHSRPTCDRIDNLIAPLTCLRTWISGRSGGWSLASQPLRTWSLCFSCFSGTSEIRDLNSRVLLPPSPWVVRSSTAYSS